MRRSLVLAGFMVITAHVFAGNWPQFRGPSGAGISEDKEIPVQFSDKDGIVWKVPIPGGNSSPVIWGDRLFLQTASDDGKERQLLCLSTANGKTLWSRSAPGAKVRTHPKNSLASSTPATDGRRVYAAFWDGQQVTLSAFDMDGKPLWTQNLGSYQSQHGFGTSPIAYGNQIFFAYDQDGQAALFALNAQSGTILWRTPRQAFRACYSTPFVLERPNAAPELIVASTAGITGYDLRSGSENWSWTWDFGDKPLRTVSSPIHGDGLIFANSGDGGGDRATVAIRADGKGDVTKTHLVWQMKKGFPYVPTMVIKGEHLFFVTDNGIANCRMAKTGEPVWTERLGGNISASLVMIDGKIYAINEGGDVFVFPASDKYQLLAKNSLGEGVLATPAVAGNRLFIRGKTHLFCIGKPAGK